MKSPVLASLCAFAFLGLLSPITEAAELTLHASTLTVPTGDYPSLGRAVTVKQPADFPVAPAEIKTVTDEPLKLSPDKPGGYAKGTRLRGPNARDVNAAGSFVPGSLELRRTKGGAVLKKDADYLIDEEWAQMGLGPQTALTAEDTVFATYRYALRRMDTIQVSASGVATLKPGTPHISAPVPPAADAGSTAIAHVFIPHRGAPEIYPILETGAQAVTKSTPGRIPKTLAKLRAGEPVKIVCLGDSVTAGGNASKPEYRYVDVFATGLRERFPKATIDVQNISAGGSKSLQWLFPEKYPYKGLHGDANPAQFQRVIDAKPDLVTIEFVNDAGLKPEQVEEVYGDILNRLAPGGTEVILITPHFTMLKMMGFTAMNEAERRPYVLGLRDFAERHHVGLADASSRWEHLWKEGLPYVSLLDNTINHPDDRGHRLFAEELWKCFE